jgi:YidC/Oxa1 family membrane protein insertase
MNSLLYPFVPHFTANPDLNLNWFTFLNPAWHVSLIHPQPVLAILAGVATFVQLRMSQPKTTSTTSTGSDPSAQSMKMMQYFMPVMITIFGWSVAAGLALYWMVSSIFQAVQQYFVTGWGSLGSLIPGLGSSTPEQKKSSTVVSASSEKRRESDAERRNGSASADEKAAEETRERVGAQRGAVSSQLRTSTKSTNKGNSQANKRSRSTSASARRRSGAQRSRS